jgi:predicted transcriptional regulator
VDFSRPLATVTPTLDGDVLAVLAMADVTFTTGQIHRMLRQFSEEGIRKVLNRLVTQGVVLAERVGNAVAYRLNHEHLAAEPIVALARLRSTFLARLERDLKDWPAPPKYAAVFGSAARGDMTVGSDLDLFLVRERDTLDEVWTRHLEELITNVTRWTGNDARTVEYTTDELHAARNETLVSDVLDHGLTVAGSRAWLVKFLRKSSATP